jgi:hypothetical protein
MSDQDNLGIDKLIGVAKEATKSGDSASAELFFQEALRKAELLYGTAHPEVGLILMDLLDVYDSQKNELAATRVFNRVREIVLTNACPELEQKMKSRKWRRYS